MRPRIVLSHECPLVIEHILYGAEMIPSRRATGLFRMFQSHEPEVWYFGHHHQAWERKLGNTPFRCLAIDEKLYVGL
jgi:hypothetical protein